MHDAIYVRRVERLAEPTNVEASSPSASSTAVAISARTAVGTRAGVDRDARQRRRVTVAGQRHAVRRRPGGSRGAERGDLVGGRDPRARRRHPCEGDVQRAPAARAALGPAAAPRGRVAHAREAEVRSRRPRARRYDRTRARAGASARSRRLALIGSARGRTCSLDLAYAANASSRARRRSRCPPPRLGAVAHAVFRRDVVAPAVDAPWRPSPNAIAWHCSRRGGWCRRSPAPSRRASAARPSARRRRAPRATSAVVLRDRRPPRQGRADLSNRCRTQPRRRCRVGTLPTCRAVRGRRSRSRAPARVDRTAPGRDRRAARRRPCAGTPPAPRRHAQDLPRGAAARPRLPDREVRGNRQDPATLAERPQGGRNLRDRVMTRTAERLDDVHAQRGAAQLDERSGQRLPERHPRDAGRRPGDVSAHGACAEAVGKRDSSSSPSSRPRPRPAERSSRKASRTT